MLAPHGLAYLAPRIHDHYGDAAHELLTANPYELTSVFGVGFVIADRIARATGADATGGRRERAAVMHVLSESERSGSACMPLGDAAGRGARELLGADAGEDVVDELERARAVVREGEWIYRAATAELEAELAAADRCARQGSTRASGCARPAEPSRAVESAAEPPPTASSPASSVTRCRRRSTTGCR